MSDIAKGVAKFKEEQKLPHVILKRVKYRSRLPGERYIDPGTGELVTFEHIEDWRNYKALRDGGHIRLATAEEIKAAEAAAKPAAPAAETAAKGGKS